MTHARLPAARSRAPGDQRRGRAGGEPQDAARDQLCFAGFFAAGDFARAATFFAGFAAAGAGAAFAAAGLGADLTGRTALSAAGAFADLVDRAVSAAAGFGRPAGFAVAAALGAADFASDGFVQRTSWPRAVRPRRLSARGRRSRRR